MTSFFAWNTLDSTSHATKKQLETGFKLLNHLLDASLKQECKRKTLSPSLKMHFQVGKGLLITTTIDSEGFGSVGQIMQRSLCCKKSAQVITCWISSVPGEQFLCSFIYASNFQADRRIPWTNLQQNKNMYVQGNTPWIVLGVFNVTLSTSEHSGCFEYSTDHLGMREFQNVVTTCGLGNPAYIGPKYTWCKKLDRELVNGDWVAQYPRSFATFEACGVSDHARCCIQIEEKPQGNKKPFMFFNYLVEH